MAAGRPIWERFGEFLFPERCFACGALAAEAWCVLCRSNISQATYCVGCNEPGDRVLCDRCRRAQQSPLDSARSAFVYAGSLPSIIMALKYRGYQTLARPLAQSLAPLIRSVLEEVPPPAPIIMVPVPSEPLRRWRRGFNPAELLAREAGLICGLEVRSDLLRRRRGGHPQVGLRKHQRHQNVVGRFVALGGTDLVGRTVILVDDVLTTSSTCREAARTLKAAGAIEVHAVTVAQD